MATGEAPTFFAPPMNTFDVQSAKSDTDAPATSLLALVDAGRATSVGAPQATSACGASDRMQRPAVSQATYWCFINPLETAELTFAINFAALHFIYRLPPLWLATESSTKSSEYDWRGLTR